MDRDSVTLGVAGLLTTLASSALGIYYIHRARTAPYREHLYQRQVELIGAILSRSADLHLRLGVLLGPHTDITAHDAVWQETAQSFEHLASLSAQAVCILPTELFDRYTAIANRSTDILVRTARDYLDPGELLAIEREIDGFAHASRAALGVDALSGETRQLFGKEQVDKLRRTLVERPKP